MYNLTQNLGTVIIGLAVACIIAAVIAKIVRDKKKGKCVGCDCANGKCPNQSSCGIK